ncbi:MAG: DUF4139 domain-containing protein [Proteobacteria bacterium]|nr:DUF4139 domain-containing protein [Pseudomonadota bacterium]
MKKIFATAAILLLALPAWARVDLVTLPEPAEVYVTIYNSADLTLVRDIRRLTLAKGENRLQFAWAGTLIDPTSLELFPREHATEVDVTDLVYPPAAPDSGVWDMESRVAADVPMEISYLTSGLSWRAFYLGSLSADEKTMDLSGYVRVDNRSGEDYPGAHVRLIVGKVHLLDEIAALARREHPYGRPGMVRPMAMDESAGMVKMARREMAMMAPMAQSAPKEIVKEGLSEYFVYSIQGTETIPDSWSKRLLSFETRGVPVENLYEFEEERWGASVMRFLSFANDRKHKLGETPIPGGDIRVFRSVDEKGGEAYEGRSQFDYIPVDQKVRLNLGAVEDVLVTPVLMDFSTDHFLFDKNGDVSGWDETRRFQITVKNTRDVPVRVRITRNVHAPRFDLVPDKGAPGFEKVDRDTVRFNLSLSPGQTTAFGYVLTTRMGNRAD